MTAHHPRLAPQRKARLRCRQTPFQLHYTQHPAFDRVDYTVGEWQRLTHPSHSVRVAHRNTSLSGVVCDQLLQGAVHAAIRSNQMTNRQVDLAAVERGHLAPRRK